MLKKCILVFLLGSLIPLASFAQSAPIGSVQYVVDSTAIQDPATNSNFADNSSIASANQNTSSSNDADGNFLSNGDFGPASNDEDQVDNSAE